MNDKESYIIQVPRFNKASGFETNSKVSAIMKRIKSSDAKPEIAFRKALWHLGIRYKKTNKNLPGKPD